jgi:phosphoglucosamine mutase
MKLFGTDGIRGNASKFPFDNTTLERIGFSIAKNLHGAHPYLIIRDTRKSGVRIEKALAKGITAAGGSVVSGGILPTPAASLLAKKYKFSAAIVISASHNPYEDNGIKIFSSKGVKLPDSTEHKIEAALTPLPKKALKPNITVDKNLAKTYENFIITLLGDTTLKNKKIVLDCANGAAYKTAPEIFKSLGAKVITINNKPDGKNINVNCGATAPKSCATAVKKHKAFIGFCFDGDGDRLICVDEKGIVHDGDYYMSVMAKALKSQKLLKNNVLVTTVMANIGLVKDMKRSKIKLALTKVGDRYVIEEMTKLKASLGGEQSGHIIFSDILPTGDGLIAAVELIKHLVKNNTTLFKETKNFVKYPQVLVNVKVAQKMPLGKLPDSQNLIKKIEKSYGSEGRVLVRYSGTENLLRVMMEGRKILEIKKTASKLAGFISREISALA